MQKITCYSLQKLFFAKYHSLLVAKFACYSLQKLLIAKNHSLLVAKFTRHSLQKLLVAKLTRYSLQKLFVAKSQSLLIAKFARCSLQKFTHYSILIAEVSSFKKSLAARCKNLLVTRCEIRLLLVAEIALSKNHWFLIATFPQYSFQKIMLR